MKLKIDFANRNQSHPHNLFMNIFHSVNKNQITFLQQHLVEQVFLLLTIISYCSTTISGWVFMISVGFNAAARFDSPSFRTQFLICLN